jgi:hypothetical protein
MSLESRYIMSKRPSKKNAALAVAAFSGLLALFLIFSRPSFRIISRSEVLDFEGREVFMIDWTVGGRESLNACFPSVEERKRFEKYLHRVGWVEE